MNKFLQWFLSPVSYVLWIALGDPSQWEDSSNTIRHKHSGYQLWTSNSIWMWNPFFDVYEHSCIGPLDRIILWPRARRIKKNMVGNKIIERMMRME